VITAKECDEALAALAVALRHYQKREADLRNALEYVRDQCTCVSGFAVALKSIDRRAMRALAGVDDDA